MGHRHRLQPVLIMGRSESKTPQVLLKTSCREPKFPEQELQGLSQISSQSFMVPLHGSFGFGMGHAPVWSTAAGVGCHWAVPSERGHSTRGTQPCRLSTPLLPVLCAVTEDKERLCVKVRCVPVAGGQRGTLVTWPGWDCRLAEQPLDEVRGLEGTHPQARGHGVMWAEEPSGAPAFRYTEATPLSRIEF